MVTHEVLTLANQSFALGSVKRNRHNYTPVKVFSVPIPDQKLVHKSSAVDGEPELEEACANFTLSPIFAHCLDNPWEMIDGIYSNRRSVTHADDIYTLDLADLGMAEESVEQEFIVDVKGVGIPQRHSEFVDFYQMEAFIERHDLAEKLEGLKLSNLPVFSFNEYLTYGTPEGSQDLDIGKCSLEGYEYFKDLGFKLAVSLCTVEYPDEIQGLASEFEIIKPVKLVLAQEKRLMPSFVRAAYFEFGGGGNRQMIERISPDQGVLDGLAEKLAGDIVPYLELPARTTERRGRKLFWDYVGYMESLFVDSNKQTKKDYSWYLAKDWVLAGSGLFFVDLESTTLDREVDSDSELEDDHLLYLTTILKDGFRLLAHYELARRGETSGGRRRRIEADARNLLIQKLNETDHVRIKERPNSFRVTLNYDDQSVGSTRYVISKSELPEVVR
jgi:hypothetical protein